MNGKKSGNTAARVYEIARNVADKLGYSVWDVTYDKEGALYYLRVFIDRPGGIGIDDCEAMTRPLSEALDKYDPVEESYILEVGSPGLGRTLRRPEHFREFMDCPVRIRYIREKDGVKEFIAVMTGFDEKKGSILVVNEQDKEIEVLLSETASVKLCDDEDLFSDAD